MKNITPRDYCDNNLTSIIVPKYIVAALAYNGVWQHPFIAPDNLLQCLHDAYEYITKQEVFVKAAEEVSSFPCVEFNYDQMVKFTSDMIDNLPNVRLWNISKAESERGVTDPDDPNRSGYSFVTRFGGPAANHDFIDLGALARNIAHTCLLDHIADNTPVS